MVLRSCFKLSKGGYNYVIHWNIMCMHWILFTLLDTFNKLGYKAKINTHTTSYIN